MALKVGELYAELGIKDNKFTAGMNKAEKDVKKADKAVGGMSSAVGMLGGALTAGAVVVGLKAAAFAASDLAESTSKANVVFGEASSGVQAFAAKAAGAMGMSSRVALEAAGTFGNLFVSIGLSQGKAADMSTSIVQLAADLASFNNVRPEDALEALRAGLVGETEPLRKFGINLNDAMLREEALSLGLVKTTKDVLPPAAKAQASYSLMLKQTGTAQGDFARTADGAANSVKIATAELENAKAELGQSLTPAMAKGAKSVSGLASGFNDLDDATQSGIVNLGLFVIAAGGIAKGVQVAGSAIKSIVTPIGTAVTAIGSGAAAVILFGAAVVNYVSWTAAKASADSKGAQAAREHAAAMGSATGGMATWTSAIQTASPAMYALQEATKNTRLELFNTVGAQNALKTATNAASAAWTAQVLALKPVELGYRALAAQSVDVNAKQVALKAAIKEYGRVSPEAVAASLALKDAQNLVAQSAATMTDKEIAAAVKSGVLSKAQGVLAAKANDAAGKVDGVTVAVGNLPSGKTVSIAVKVSGVSAAMASIARITNARRLDMFVKPTSHATGGYFTTPHVGVVGDAKVGEYVINPSLANAPALIMAAARSAGMVKATASTTISNVFDFSGTVVRELADIDRIAEAIAARVMTANRAAGVA